MITDWIGREETTQARLDAHVASMLSATLDAEPRIHADGEPADPLWHWCAFPPMTATHALGADGHPEKGGFLPPVALPRRMWAGGTVTFHRELHVGERLTRHSRIASVEEKHGKAGPMVFVAVHHEIHGESGHALSERHDIVYLPMPVHFAPPPPKPVPAAVVAEDMVDMPPPLLFRYSACTFNAHRIHYDLDYAREVEKYPGLVVHGPLQATLMMRLACRVRGRAPARFDYRGLSPMLHGHLLRVLAVTEDDGLFLCTAKGHERQGMMAHAYWED
jgi:3-methylfumaryl-CoA hydratase